MEDALGKFEAEGGCDVATMMSEVKVGEGEGAPEPSLNALLLQVQSQCSAARVPQLQLLLLQRGKSGSLNKRATKGT